MDLKGSHVNMFKNQMVKFDLVRISIEMVKVNTPIFPIWSIRQEPLILLYPIQSPFPLPKDMHTGRERERERERERHGVMGVKFNNLAFGGRVSAHYHDGSLF